MNFHIHRWHDVRRWWAMGYIGGVEAGHFCFAKQKCRCGATRVKALY